MSNKSKNVMMDAVTSIPKNKKMQVVSKKEMKRLVNSQKKMGGKAVPGLMNMNMKDRMAKLRSMRGKKTVKRGGQFGEIAIPAAAIALGSMAPSILSGAYGAANSAYHYLFDKKTKPVVPTAIVPQQI